MSASKRRNEMKMPRSFGIAVIAAALAMAAGAKPATAQTAATNAAPQQSSSAQLVPQMPGPAPTKPYHFPNVATKTLANGLRVFVVSSSEMPAVGMQLVLTSAGSVNDPEGKPGVASMVASLLTQGTDKRSAQQIAEAIDFVGGSLTANAGDDGTVITTTVVKKDFDLAMDLLSDVTLRAKFQPEEIERQRQQLLSNIRVNYDDADYLATAVFQRVVFGMHPYGLPNEGTPASVQGMKRDDLIHFHDTFYSPGSALLAFSGDISPDAAFAAAEKYFGAWPKKETAGVSHAAPEIAAGMHITIINKPDAVQTQIRVGKPGIRRNDPDYIPLFVANRVFGGSYNSRLNTEVRLKKGLTYDASSFFDSRHDAGSFLASTYTRTEATVDALKLVVDQITGMAGGNVKPEELNFARDYMVGVYPIQTETPVEVAGRVLTVAQFGLPADYNDTYQSRIAGVTLAQVNSVSTRYFQPSTLEIVLVGNAAQFRDALKKAFPGAIYDEFGAADLDLLLPELHRKPEVVPAPTPETLAQGKTILQSAAQASGGPALSKVQSIEYSALGQLVSTQGDLQVQLKLYMTFPDHYRLDTQVALGGSAPMTLALGYGGKSGWANNPDGFATIPPDQNIEFTRRLLLIGGLGIYRAVQAGGIQAQSIGQRDFQGQKADAVAITSGDIHVTVYFDPTTHLAAGAKYSQDVAPQGHIETTEVWSDYREVEGIKFPCHNVTFRNGLRFSESSVKEIKLNTNPNPDLFVKP